MKINELFKTFLAVAVCLSTLSGAVVAQQPFDALPNTDAEDASDDEEPLIVRPGLDRTPSRPFRNPADQEDAPDQTVLLNADFAGWQEAGLGVKQNRVGKDLRANWIMVDDNGRFEGLVRAGEGVDVRDMNIYLMNMGRLVKETTVDSEGRFNFTNVRQGAYSIIGWGSKGFFAYGLNILAYNQDANSSTPRSINVTAFQNASTINTDWIQYFAPRVNYRVFGRYRSGEGQKDPAALYGFDGLVRYQPKASPATSISGRNVAKTADGRLLGRVHQLNSLTGRPVDVRTTKVMLLKGDNVVASTNTDNYGVFEFQDIADGAYGLVAAGVDGMGLIGINVGSSTGMNDLGQLADSSGDLFDFTIVSSETVGWLNHYADEVAYRRNLLAPRRPDPADNQYCDTCGGTGCQTCYGTGLCTSKCQSFREWAMNCRNQHENTKIGSGYILSEAAKDLRGSLERADSTFERAFYGNGGNGISGGGGNYNGFQN
jgi:hypothetical protein